MWHDSHYLLSILYTYDAENSALFSVQLKKYCRFQHVIMKTTTSNRYSITANYDRITDPDVFRNLFKVLMAYAYRLIGDGSIRLERSRQDLAYDFTMEAIMRHLENPGKFNPERNPDLVWYLKYYILRQLVSNFKESKGQKQELAYPEHDPDGMHVMDSYIEAYDIHDHIDLEKTIEIIYGMLSNDQPLLELFKLRYLEQYSRAETISELSITSGEYNNRIRRLDTVFNRVVKMQS